MEEAACPHLEEMGTAVSGRGLDYMTSGDGSPDTSPGAQRCPNARGPPNAHAVILHKGPPCASHLSHFPRAPSRPLTLGQRAPKIAEFNGLTRQQSLSSCCTDGPSPLRSQGGKRQPERRQVRLQARAREQNRACKEPLQLRPPFPGGRSQPHWPCPTQVQETPAVSFPDPELKKERGPQHLGVTAPCGRAACCASPEGQQVPGDQTHKMGKGPSTARQQGVTGGGRLSKEEGMWDSHCPSLVCNACLQEVLRAAVTWALLHTTFPFITASSGGCSHVLFL